METDYLKKYRMTFDYHTHTVFSHGKGTIEDNVKEAMKKGLKAIAISDHGPGHLTYGVKRRDFPVMREEIQRLNDKYKDINIFLSVEANITNRYNYLDVTKKEFNQFDFVIAGYHYGITHGYCIGNWLENHVDGLDLIGKKLLIKNTDMTIRALHENDIKILTHPGDKGRFDIGVIAKACEETNTLMEISTWHTHLTVDEIKLTSSYDVKYIISSDAHTPNRVGSFLGGVKRAIQAGIDMDRIANIEENIER
ncbi:MAG: PHP domain-containing protein [Eubacteriales bacterium]|nr:PHP domain-containing protein [Eubacteriales bacterium]